MTTQANNKNFIILDDIVINKNMISYIDYPYYYNKIVINLYNKDEQIRKSFDWDYTDYVKYPELLIQHGIPKYILIFCNDEQLKQKIPIYEPEMRGNIKYFLD